MEVLAKYLQTKDPVSGKPETATINSAYLIENEDLEAQIGEFAENSILKDAVSKKLDLREYAFTVEQELKEAESLQILEYVKQTDEFAALYSDIKSCDSILESMFNLLQGFQVDLEKVSEEIETLQMESKTLNSQVKNRTNVQKSLNEVLEGVLVTPDLIKKICDGEINEFYIQHLNELNHKMSFVKSHQVQNLKCLKDAGPELEKLRLKAVDKIQDFLLKKVESLKAQNTNIAIIQQGIFLKYKELFWFVLERYGEVAIETTNTYIQTVGSYYLQSFDKYIRSTQRTMIADKADLIGSEETNTTKILGLFTTSKTSTLKDKSNVYSLGDRINILTSSDPGIIVPYMVEDQNQKLAFERMFKSIYRLLMDNACSEYIFATEFFNNPHSKRQKKIPIEPIAVFNDVFEPTLKHIHGFLKQVIDSSYDAISILICIRVVFSCSRIMEKRCVPCLDVFLNSSKMMLWPRFQAVIDLHIESLKKSSTSRLLASKDPTPHFVTRRFAEFSVSVLTLNQGYDDSLLLTSHNRLRAEMESWLFRMSGEFTDRKIRFVFLINNYDLIISIYSENHNIPTIQPEKEYFQALLDNKTAEFVEQELTPFFGNLIRFLHLLEHEKDISKVDQSKFEKVAGDFNGNWKNHLQTLNGSVVQSFPNFQNGARILHVLLTQLLVYYKKFLEFWDIRMKECRTSVVPISIQSIMVEMKKYKSNF